ncbi:hypothetical protein KM043_017631 [Ampulex compressa]|nr:hypothetical protein KM043_017631 [Ampulex compressa]
MFGVNFVMEEFLAEQQTLSGYPRLEEIQENLEDSLTFEIVRNRLKRLREEYARFEQTHAKIIATATKELTITHQYFTEDKYAMCEATYYAVSDYITNWEAQLELATDHFLLAFHLSTSADSFAKVVRRVERMRVILRSIQSLDNR